MNLKLVSLLCGFVVSTLSALVVLPKIYVPSVYSAFPIWKEFLVICGPLCLLFLLPRGSIFSREGRLLLSEDLRVFSVGLFSILILSVIFLTAGDGSIKNLLIGLIPYCIFIFLNFIFPLFPRDLKYKFSLGVALSLVVLTIGVIYDYFTEYFYSLSLRSEVFDRTYSKLEGGVIRPAFLFDGSTNAGMLMACLVVISAFLFVNARNKKTSYVCLFICIIGLCGVLATMARVGYGGLAIFCMGLMTIRYFRHLVCITSSFLLLIALILTLTLSINLDLGPLGYIVDRLQITFTSAALTESANSMRTDAWAQGFAVCLDALPFGQGVGTSQGRLSFFGVKVEHYESGFLSLFAETGVVMVPYFSYLLLARLKNVPKYITSRTFDVRCNVWLASLMCFLSMFFANPALGGICFTFLFSLFLSLSPFSGNTKY